MDFPAYHYRAGFNELCDDGMVINWRLRVDEDEIVAQLPPIRRIFREDLGPDVPQWVTRLLAPLNLVLDTVYRALDKQLDFGVNIRSQLRTFIISAGAAASNNTYSFPVELGGRKPTGLWVTAASRTDGVTEVFATPVFATWAWNSQANTIEISGITGLTNGTAYFISVLVI